MRDDERYPQAVEPGDHPYHSAPEVVTDHYGQDKQALMQDPKGPMYYAGGGWSATPTTPETQAIDESLPEPVSLGSKQKRICGMKKRTFIIVMVILLCAIIGGVVGGVVGGLANDGKLGNGGGDESSDGSNNGEDPPESAPTSTMSGPIEATQRAMAVSLSVSEDDAEDQELQLFYQDLETQNVLYRRIVNDEPQREEKLGLDLTPLWGSPLAAAATNMSSTDDDSVSTQLYYLTNGDDDEPAIAEARLNCNRASATTTTCTTRSNVIISTDAEARLDPASKLAALRLDEETVRVYYQDVDGSIYALSGDNAEEDGSGWTAHSVTTEAVSGSSFAVVGPNREDVSLFFISEADDALCIVRYSDIQGPTDEIVIDDRPGSEWSTGVSLTAVNVPFHDPYRAYYAQPGGGDIVSYWQAHGDATGNFMNNHADEWGTVEGGFAAAAWANQVRIYYFQDGDLVVSAATPGWDPIESLDE